MTDSQNTCPDCMTTMPQEYRFCGQCGASMVGMGSAASCWVIDVLDIENRPLRTVPVLPGEQLFGRSKSADICVDDDPAVSPKHALVTLRDEAVTIEDQGARNGVFMPVVEATALEHNDLVRAGGQLFRFQLIAQLGKDPVVPVPHPAFGPTRPAWARLLRYNRHGQVTNARILESDRFEVGRRRGDWVLSKARTLSGSHFAIVRSEGDAVSIEDSGSRNGTFVEMRRSKVVKDGERFLIGDRCITVRNVSLNAYHAVLNASASVQEAEAVDLGEVDLTQTVAAIPEAFIERAMAGGAVQPGLQAVVVPSPDDLDDLLSETSNLLEDEAPPPVEISNPAMPAVAEEVLDWDQIAPDEIEDAAIPPAAPSEVPMARLAEEVLASELSDNEEPLEADELVDEDAIAAMLAGGGEFGPI